MKKIFSILLVIALIAPSPVLASSQEEVSPKTLSQNKETSLKGPVSSVIAFPFELIKWPIDKSLVYIEQQRLDKKAIWMYEKMMDYGVTPVLGTMDSVPYPYYGADLDLMKITRQKEKAPDFIFKTQIYHGPEVFFHVGSEIGAQRIADTGAHLSGFFQYRDEENNSFYGLGPKSSRGDSMCYGKEATTLGVAAGYEFSPTLDLVSKFSYDHVNINTRRHDGKANILNTFSERTLPGLAGDDLLGYSLALNRDTRDSKDAATRGSYQKLLFKYTEGVNDSRARYFTYQLDLAKYFRLGSPRRIFVARFFGEHHQTINGGSVPFYNMTKLGGSGIFPRESQTERAFAYNRFFDRTALLLNLEYRYAVWEYREYKMSVAFFVDEGQVFRDFGRFQFKNFRESYGIGFYLTYSKNMLLDFSVAHGDEGTRLYLKNKIAF